MKDYYEILELPSDATQEEIREQYYFLIQAWHPDKFPRPAQKARAEERSKEINIAYSVLKDVQKRAKYDSEHRVRTLTSREDDPSPAAERKPGGRRWYTSPYKSESKK